MGRVLLRRVRWRIRQPIGLHAHQKARPEILRETEELVDVALPVGDMHAALRRAEKRHRLAQVLEPAVALFGLDRHARGFTCRLSVHVPLNLLRVQNFTAVRPRGVPANVTARLACIRTLHRVSKLGCPAL